MNLTKANIDIKDFFSQIHNFNAMWDIDLLLVVSKSIERSKEKANVKSIDAGSADVTTSAAKVRATL